jgi:hypothetical protein
VDTEENDDSGVDAKPPGKFRWTERRAARFILMLASMAVVIGDAILLSVFLRTASAFPREWRIIIPIGIAAIFLFAMARLRRQLRLFRLDQ